MDGADVKDERKWNREASDLRFKVSIVLISTKYLLSFIPFFHHPVRDPNFVFY